MQNHFDGEVLINSAPGGRVTTIYAGTGCAIFWGTFFRGENKFEQKINLGVLFLVKSKLVINSGVLF